MRDIIARIARIEEDIRRLKLRPPGGGGADEEVFVLDDWDYFFNTDGGAGWYPVADADWTIPRAFRVGNLVYWSGRVEWFDGDGTYPYEHWHIVRAGFVPSSLLPAAGAMIGNVHQYIGGVAGSYPYRHFQAYVSDTGTVDLDNDHYLGTTGVDQGETATTWQLDLSGLMYPVALTV